MEEMKLNVTTGDMKITANFEAFEKWIEDRTHEYDGVVFTEDQKAAAKKSVADLRKTKKSVEDTLKTTKKLWLEPFEVFSDKVKALSAKLDAPIDYILKQVEEFENKRIAEREADIQRIYDENIGDMVDFLPLYKIKSDKWTNASTNIKAITKELTELVNTVRTGKMAIEAMVSEAKEEALCKFKATLNLTDALDHINKYEAQKAEILKREEARMQAEQEHRIQAEIERAKQEERRKIAKEERIRKEAEEAARVEVKEEIKTINEVAAAPLTMPESIKAVYTVVGTDAELQELEMAMNSLGLYFERKNL
ncbi:DUF1351 domain-containing protein [Clostridium sp. HBUAS56010]|uniref:DUF1351 domain-containing protein n=1 Tax=Clostridium sp. HBUAS56010 TaxID=2571127 RepID=UPI001177E1E1|nr:DUF1351 domain-containing protein [Clostridium sp. HBUAS56010]